MKKKGIFHGEVIAVEYESADEDKVEPIYVVEYTDGDREQNNYVMAKNFFTQLCSPMKSAPTSAVVVTKKRATDRLRWV